MARLVEDGEIDDWFAFEKEALGDRLTTDLKRGVDYVKAKDRFDEGFAHLFKEYEEKYRDAAQILAQRERLQRPIRKFRQWRAERKLAWTLWWKRQKEGFKKWRFEREYRRLFHLKKKI